MFYTQLFSTGRPTPETMEAFQREVFVMNCLRHPNVVLLLGACQTPPKLAIIMEFIAGGSLHQVRLSLSLPLTLSISLSLSLSLSPSPLSLPPPLQLIHVDKARPSVTEIAQLATDICRGLQYLHSINVLHRYIHVWTHTTRTPQNLCTMYYIQCKYYHT